MVGRKFGNINSGDRGTVAGVQVDVGYIAERPATHEESDGSYVDDWFVRRRSKHVRSRGWPMLLGRWPFVFRIKMRQ